MLRRARLPFISLFVVLITRAAAAQSVIAPTPYYASLGAGLVRLQNAPMTYDASAPRVNRDIGFDPGWAVSGALGRRFGDHVRIEFEVNHRGDDVKSVTPGSLPGGEMDSTGFMANGFYDIKAALPITPYIGAGVGVAIMRQTVGSGGGQLARATDTGPAYQFVAGFSFPFGNVLVGTVDYRFFGSAGLTFEDSGNLPYDTQYRTHSIVVGIRVPM